MHKRKKVIASKGASIAIDSAYVGLRHLMRSLLPELTLTQEKVKDIQPKNQKEENIEPQKQEPVKKRGDPEL